jgi:hypothetical protein
MYEEAPTEFARNETADPFLIVIFGRPLGTVWLNPIIDENNRKAINRKV